MTGTMKKIRLGLLMDDGTRRALRLEAARLDMDMSPLAEAILGHVLAQLAAGKAPKDLVAAIETRKAEAAEEDE